jgi:hypothetical protein
VLQPVGPLPASVYWRRRALAVAVVLLVLIIGWAVLPGGGDGGDRQPNAGAAGSSTPPGGVPAETSLAATPPAGDPGRVGAGNDAPITVPPTTVPPTTTPAPVRTTPPAPKPCADTALTLKVVPERTAYDVGQSPVLDLQVSNTSKLACVRDLGAAQQEIVLYRGSQRLWSSNDCYPEGERRSTVLAPGASQSFEVTWSGLGSRPRCAGQRARVGAGTYSLVGRIGTLNSRRTAITLR